MATYNDTIEKMKTKHKEYSELGREYRKLQNESRLFYKRALEAAYNAKLLDDPVNISSRKAPVCYRLYTSETGITCSLSINAPWRSHEYEILRETYPSSGNIKTIVSRLRKVEDGGLYDRVTSLFKFLENYSE